MLVRRAVSEDTANGASGGDLYQCQSVQVEADFTDPGLQLTFDGNTYELEPVQAASGARFAMGQGVSRVEFWSRGDNALFRIGEDDDGWEECRRMAPDASMGGIDEAEQYVAMGQEPGWRLILAGSALRLTADYGERTVEAEVTTYDQTPDGDRIRAGEGDEAVEVLISPEQCADIMSGMPYPDTVTVRFDDRELNGCGGDPESLLAGGAWRVTEIGGEAVETEPAPAITFEGNGRMTGRGPCNTFTGGYEMTGEGIVLTGVAATRRACADESLNAVEQRFFAMLDGRAIYQFGEEGEMRVQAGDGEFVAIRD
jgi:heat shock protein HslJ/membrane-bound inhibitor of C-type lysozyme